MPDAAVVEAPVTQPAAESLGWRAGLPDELKQNADLANFKTVGDFAKHALEVQGKVGELEGKLKDAIPKLPDDATDEDRAHYYDALGRPAKPEEYEFDGEDKNAPEWTGLWKNEFHKLGLTKAQGKALTAAFNKVGQDYIKKDADARSAELTTAEQKLRSELGDKYDTSVELAKRMYAKHLTTEFDADFADATPKARFGMVRLLLKVASLTGEDTSPQSSQGATKDPKKRTQEAWLEMYKNPVGGK